MPLVLAIADDPNMLRVLAALLTNLHCQVFIAHSGPEGESLVQN